jgi:TorA maturation chaperone TorD
MNDTDKTLQRGDCFKLMAACFYEPDKQLFIEEKLGEKLEQLLDQLAPNCVPAVRQMKNALKQLEQEQLSIDHAALFIGPFELIAAPYGSVYIEKKRTVMGDSTINVAQFYQDAGLSVDIKEPPDHIAIELEFLHYLCSKEAAALNNNQIEDARLLRERQIGFYFTALKPWAETLCEAIRRGTENGFYRNLADCLDHYLSSFEQLCHEEYTVEVE